jgi:hypothetical protein
MDLMLLLDRLYVWWQLVPVHFQKKEGRWLEGESRFFGKELVTENPM